MTTAIEPAEIEISEPNKFQVMPPLTDDDFAALKADIQANGLLIPVEVDEDGNVLDGHHRVRACTELGIEWRGKGRCARGLTEAEKRSHARRLNIARRHLTGEQKRELIAQQLVDTPEQSDRAIAKALGVRPQAVAGGPGRRWTERGEIAHAETAHRQHRPASSRRASRRPRESRRRGASAPARNAR